MVPGIVVVHFKPEVTEDQMLSFLEAMADEGRSTAQYLHALKYARLKVPTGTESEVIRELSVHPLVEMVDRHAVRVPR